MRKRIFRFLWRAMAVMLALAGLTWTADWLWLKHRVAQSPDAFGSVEVHRRFAVHLKHQRIEQRTEKPHPEECVHSLFSHYDDEPCWYLQRHAQDTEDVDSGPWHFFSE
jgi:hypothetical protein